MAYSELIKNFNRTREYMRDFYVYGFKSRGEYDKKSARSYDNEKRRVESWLGDYMGFRHTEGGKNVFISIDSRVTHHNPLFKAWKTKSFTDGDITLHFLLLDILSDIDISLTLNEIIEQIDTRLCDFDTPMTFDESTVRKKLKEYVSEGIILCEKKGKTVYYSRTKDFVFDNTDVLDFFSETAPCGVVGSFLIDKCDGASEHFAFKHHYITNTLDSETVCTLFEAMRQKCCVTLCLANNRSEFVLPLQIMISVQNGRQYLLAYSPKSNRMLSYRTDNISEVHIEEVSEDFDRYRDIFKKMKKHLWGVSTKSASGKRMEHIEFTVKYANNEEFIHNRLVREKRCGTVERLDRNTSRFTADIYDANEIVPWIRTFIGRITDISFSDKALEKQFLCDIRSMYELYGIEGVTANDIQ